MSGQDGNTTINACGSRLVSLISCLIDEGKEISSPTQVEHSFTVLQYANLQGRAVSLYYLTLAKQNSGADFSDHALSTVSHNHTTRPSYQSRGSRRIAGMNFGQTLHHRRKETSTSTPSQCCGSKRHRSLQWATGSCTIPLNMRGSSRPKPKQNRMKKTSRVVGSIIRRSMLDKTATTIIYNFDEIGDIQNRET